MSHKDDIENILKKHLSNESATVGGDLFAQIESTILSNQKRKKRKALILWLSLFALLISAILWLKSCSIEKKSASNIRCFEGKNIAQNRLAKTKNNLEIQTANAPLKETSQDNALHSINATNSVSNSTYNSSSSTASAQITSKAAAQTQTKTIPKTDTVKSQIIGVETDSTTTLANGLITNNAAETETTDALNTAQLTETVDQDSVLTQIEMDSLSLEDGKESKNDLGKPPHTASSKFGIALIGGYHINEMAVFKSYLSSGFLSGAPFSASGHTVGFEFYRKIGDRLSLNIAGNYQKVNTSFTGNLLIGESDYFLNYLEGNEIPIANLDDPDECNCYTANDVSLTYTLQTFSAAIGAQMELIQLNKITIGTQLNSTFTVRQNYNLTASEVISFEQSRKENFSNFGLRLGVYNRYQITDKIGIGLSPYYHYQFNVASELLQKNTNQIGLDLRLEFSF